MSLDRPLAPNPYDLLPAVASFTLASDDIVDGEPLPTRHVAPPDGDNESPHLTWSGFPEATRSFAVTCFDPDAPTPSGFWHWAAVNVPADTTTLARDAGREDAALPGGAFHLRGDGGTVGYAGSAPPEGDRAHRYYFVVHAVDVPELPVDASTSAARMSFQLAFHTLGRAILMGTYAR